MFFGMKHWILWLSICHTSYISGENLCKRELLQHFNISTALQSDVLLPCYFNPALLGSDQTADIAVVWSQRNTTEHNLVEITLQGEQKSWDDKGRRIKTFPELSESGNFSILLQKVQPYDLSLYRCELFKGFNCSIAYQEIQLKLTVANFSETNWPFIAAAGGGGGGGAVALTLLVVLICCIRRARSSASNEHVYANTRFQKRNDKECHEEKHNSNHHATEAKNGVFDNMPQNRSNVYANIHVEAGGIYANQPH